MFDFLKRGRLKAQSIHRLCQPTRFFGLVKQQPLLVPYSKEKIRVNGKSRGLSAASYDVSIDHDLTLGPNPGYVIRKYTIAQYKWATAKIGDPEENSYLEAYNSAIQELIDLPPCYSLAYTAEDFFMPHNVSADVADKSTYARLFVSAFNTFIDPGFIGNLTLEIVNHSAETVVIKKGDPICQIIFTWTDGKTDRPYDGKYQHQKKEANAARLENTQGTAYVEKRV